MANIVQKLTYTSTVKQRRRGKKVGEWGGGEVGGSEDDHSQVARKDFMKINIKLKKTKTL